MATLYGVPPSPFVRKVMIVLAEKNITYQLERIVPFNIPENFKDISPLGKVPAWRDDQLTIADSSVICAYLEKCYPTPRLYPEAPASLARALWFEEYADTELFHPLVPDFFFEKLVAPKLMGRPTDEVKVKRAEEHGIPTVCHYLEQQLNANEDYLVDNQYSIADIAIGSPFVNFMLAGGTVDATRYPNLARYLKHLFALPHFSQAIIDSQQSLAKMG